MEQAARIILIIIVITEPRGIKTPGLLFIIIMRPSRHSTIPHMHPGLFWRPVQSALPDPYSLAVSETKRAEPAADAYDDGGSNMHVVFYDITFISGFPAFRHNIPLLLLLCAIELVLLLF